MKLIRMLQGDVASALAPGIERLLGRVSLSGRRYLRALSVLVDERLRRREVSRCWLLRLPPGGSFWRQMRHAGLPQALLILLGAYAAGFSLLLLSWWALGRGAFEGRLPHAWLLLWALLLTSILPARWFSLRSEVQLTAWLGALLKRRLLAGALALEPEEIRHHGAGELLGRGLESEAVEFYALQGGFLAVAGSTDVLLSAVVLAQGAGSSIQLSSLVLWVVLFLFLARRYFVHRRSWTLGRLEMTHGVVENLVGHRTRVAQEPRRLWHDEEDRRLRRYADLSQRMDRSHLWLLALIPRGWLVVGLCGAIPAFVALATPPVRLALAVGGVLAAHRGLSKLAEGFGHLAGAVISWEQAGSLFHAASRPRDLGAAVPPGSRETGGGPGKALEAQRLTYRHAGRTDSAVRGCSVRLSAGDRLLVEGPSGSGKSTLAALLSGLRRPHAGLLLLDGVDLYSLGAERWRKKVVLAPQFHENHVFTGTFGFNLLMGRRWPPEDEDLIEALAICEELGLGEVLARMPGGLQQTLGESGWQLSHGERSRLYVARALLQQADVVILDESIAALDSVNLERAISCVLSRAPALLLIAHP